MSAQRKSVLQPSFPLSGVQGQAGPHTAQHSVGFLVVQSCRCPWQGVRAQVGVEWLVCMKRFCQPCLSSIGM